MPNLISQTSNSPFIEINESVLINAQDQSERIITPNVYSTLALDTDRLSEILSSVPQEEANGFDRSEPFEILLPNGATEAFHLVEYVMMEPGLAAQFPEIKTYYGYGVNDRSRRIRLDWTINGLNAMLQLPEGLAFLKPYSNGNTEHYLTYYEQDLPVNTEPFKCGTVDEKLIEPAGSSNILVAGDCQLRTYRLAVAVTGEYATNTLGASAAGTPADDATVNAHIVTSINQINGWYERDLAARFVLIANLADIFYYVGATDPYTNNDGVTMLAENVTNLDAVIGSPNYDIGHVLGNAGGSGGVATLNSLCGANKARGVTRASAFGITQPRFLKVWSHEMGHQFGAGHTQNEDCQRSSASAMEPGAGTTIMSYVTSACDNQIQNVPDYYFHAISLQQMSARMTGTNCATILASANSAPTISAGTNVTVPSSTPLLLQATASDTDGDPLTYTWEQFNNDMAEAIPPESTNTLGPNFRSFPPSNESGRYLPNIAAVVAGTTPTWEVLPSVARTMDFRVTVRDNSTNSISCTAEANIEITTVAAGPFLVTSPTTSGVIWIEGGTETVSWNVAGTNVAPVSCANVDILLSYDGGLTYPVTLANGVPNNGSANIVVPVGVSTTARVQVRCSDNIFYNISATDFEIQTATTPTFLLSLPNPLSTICPGDVESNVTLSTTALSGFTGDVSLSANNLPGIATLTFDNSLIPAGSGTAFTVSNTSNLAQGQYTITIVGTSGSIVREFNYQLTVEEPAGLTTLDQPADNATDLELFPPLSWVQKSNATAYDLQVSDDPTFASLVVSTTVTTNSYSFNSSLQGLTDYYWRVLATTDCGDTPWSTSRQFTTKDCAAAFIQNAPETISGSGTPVVTSVLTVSGSGTIDGLEITNINGTHTYVSDLSVELIGPGGSPTVLLWSGLCGVNNDFNLSLSDAATASVSTAGCNPLGQGGTFIPSNPLSVFDGLSIAGDWTLRINDNANQDGGQLTSWGLEFCTLTALPVDLLSFEAAGQQGGIQLDWETANEFNNEGFDIERRTDADREFETIGNVRAADDLQAVNNYQYFDKDVQPGTRYYYRLRQNDFDGQFEYSDIRTAILKDTKFALQVYPTPVRGTLFGSLNAPSDSATELRLYDLNGRIIKEQTVSENQFIMDLEGFPAGLYVLKAFHAKGEEVIKVIVE